jgi:hypothetical protein
MVPRGQSIEELRPNGATRDQRIHLGLTIPEKDTNIQSYTYTV